MHPPAFTRRSLIAIAASAATLRSPARAAAAAPFAAATLLVGGPGGGGVDAWADWLAPALGPALFPGVSLRKDVVGGVDGVTAANQFEAWAVPDGSTAALLPGAAALAWLSGDPRARFDAARWLPAMAATTPCLVASRLTLSQLAAAPLRLAATTPAGKEWPAMLALDVLGVAWQPVWGLPDPAAALASQQVDAIYLAGRHVPQAAATLAAAGAAPLFSFGALDDAGTPQRAADFPDVPAATELFANRTVNEHLLAGWHAAASAAALNMALVLPQLTPAAMVAQWRRACAQASGSALVQAQAAADGLRPIPAPAAGVCTAAVLADTAALLELRRWLALRLDYRPV